MKIWVRRHWLFVLMVVAPTIFAVVYFGLIASNVYVSESRYVVRSPQRPVQSGLVGQLLQGSGIARSQDDAYSVRDYILSRDALKELEETIQIRESYSSDAADFLDRFPGLHWDRSFEQFYRYYGDHVGVEYDPVSAISILTVRAFTADDAYKINVSLTQMSEQLVNTLNDRSRQDMIRFAENEVHLASEKAKDAAVALLTYRSSQSVFEPEKQAALQLEGIAKLQQELIATETELAQLKKLSPDNPQIESLKARAQLLREAIESEALKVTGARGSLSARAPNYERLALDLEFADKELGLSMANLETARSDALQKQLYLERLVQPNLPDKATEPRRLRSILTVLIFSLVVWSVASIMIASVREHAD